MLQDRLTGTRVVWATSEDSEETAASAEPAVRPDLFPRPWYAAGFIVGASVIGVVFSFFIYRQLDSSSLWQIEDTTGAQVATVLEGQVADEHGIRCVVGLSSELFWSQGGSGSDLAVERRLVVDVWIPAILWEDNTIVNVRNTVLGGLTVEPGFYDSGEFVITTGTKLFYVSRRFGLTMP